MDNLIHMIPGARNTLAQCGVEVPRQETPSTSFTAPRILVVDDDPPIRKLTDKILSYHGYSVATAESAAEAETMMNESRRVPDLLLVDVCMPEESGLSFVARLRKSAHYCAIPVIFVSSMSDPHTVAAAINLGAKSFITKPFKIRKFADTIARTLGQTRYVELEAA